MILLSYRTIVLLLTLSLIHTPFQNRSLAQQAVLSPISIITLSVRATPGAALESKLALNRVQSAELLYKAKAKKADMPLSLTDLYVSIAKDGQEKLYRMEQTGSLWSEPASERLVLTQKAAKQLQTYADELRDKLYGDMIPWSEAQQIVPRKSFFSVTDLETGLTFRVQRRAGSDHADVQPVTAEDTKIMKQIYNNHWSWKRKAIIVQSGNEKLAASMNGMPHGGDGIPNNGFKGHFCIHFYGSSTHKSDRPDVFHQWMVYRAAGKRQAFVDTASPYSLAEVFVESMGNHDADYIRELAGGLPGSAFDSIIKEMGTISSTHVIKPKKTKAPNDSDFDNQLAAEIKLNVALRYNNRKERSATYIFKFARDSFASPWRVNDIVTK